MGEWKNCTLSDLGTVVGGATPSTKRTENYDGGTIAWITPKDLAGFSGRFISRGERDITEVGLKSCSTQLMPAHTVLFSSRAPIGYVAIAQQEVCTNQGFKSIVPNEKTDFMFLYYLLKYSKDKIEHLGSGTTFKEVSGSTMRNVEVRVPVTLKEQKQIASVLSTLDDKIEKNLEINRNLEEQAKLVFTNWLTGCSNMITIGELSQNVLDYTPNVSPMVKLLNSSDVTEGVFQDVDYVPNLNLKGHFKKRIQFGDILYSEIRPRNHHYGIVQFDSTDYIVSTRLMVIRALPGKISPALLYQYFLLPEVEAEFTLKTESRSGTFPQGNYVDMASIKVPYMPVSEQGVISTTIEQFREIISFNYRENQLLVQARDALLPRLMSGELDVSNLDL